jgi:hypothetical protein
MKHQDERLSIVDESIGEKNQDTVRQGRKYRVSADRTSAIRKVKYQEGSQPEKSNCTICDIDS